MRYVISYSGKLISETDYIYFSPDIGSHNLFSTEEECYKIVADVFPSAAANKELEPIEKILASEWIKENTSEQFQA